MRFCERDLQKSENGAGYVEAVLSSSSSSSRNSSSSSIRSGSSGSSNQ